MNFEKVGTFFVSINIYSVYMLIYLIVRFSNNEEMSSSLRTTFKILVPVLSLIILLCLLFYLKVRRISFEKNYGKIAVFCLLTILIFEVLLLLCS
jgi:hypothetical protein